MKIDTKIDTVDWERFSHPLGFIRLILLVDWDPIGVLGYAEAMDEYDSYALGVYDLLAADASQEDLVAHLRRIEREHMGVPGNSDTILSAVAAKLRDACDTVRGDQD